MLFPSARRAFSLVELVIVVVILAIIAAIAIPRMSRGAAGVGDRALAGDLAVLRKAIDLFQAEHAGLMPNATTIETQLTGYTDASGGVGAPGGTHIYGPYLRDVPPLPVGARKGQKAIASGDAANVGWIYDGAGGITANCTNAEVDENGKQYNQY